MLAKGWGGATPRADGLELWPGAVCRRRETFGYAVHWNGQQIASGGSAGKAWEGAVRLGLRRVDRERAREAVELPAATPIGAGTPPVRWRRPR